MADAPTVTSHGGTAAARSAEPTRDPQVNVRLLQVQCLPLMEHTSNVMLGDQERALQQYMLESVPSAGPSGCGPFSVTRMTSPIQPADLFPNDIISSPCHVCWESTLLEQTSAWPPAA